MSVTTFPGALAAIDPEAVDEAYDARGLGDVSDAQLIDAAITMVARPSGPPADSFLLHAPLELLARVALLQQVAPADRETARKRIVWLAARHEQVCEPFAGGGERDFEHCSDAAAILASALAAGELDDVDRAASW